VTILYLAGRHAGQVMKFTSWRIREADKNGALLTRVIAPAAAVTVTLVMSTSGAMAQPGGAADWASPGQWPMAGQNIDDTHFQAAEHQISPANVGRLAP
jgi:hypothetical protein